MNVSKRLNNFDEMIFPVLIRMKQVVEKKTGRKVMDFSLGSPDFPPSKIYISKLKEYYDDPKAHMYPGWGGIPELTNAIADWYQKRFNVKVDSKEIYPTLGGREAITHLSIALMDEGDEVLIPDPGYIAYANAAQLINTTPVYYTLHAKNGYQIDYEELKSKITAKTKFIWVNYPSNPLGAITTEAELIKLVQFAREHGIWLIYDNAYSEITFDNFIAPSILQIPGAKEIAVELNTFSKSHSFAGYRMAWIVGNKEIIAALAKVKSHMDAGMSRALQLLGAFALAHPDSTWHKAMINSYKERRDIVAAKLLKLGLEFEIPQGALYLWARIPNQYKNSTEYVKELLETKQVLFTPGIAFGKNGDRYVRVSFCVNIEGIDEYL